MPESTEEQNLLVYIKYEYLTVAQKVEILKSIESLYNCIVGRTANETRSYVYVYDDKKFKLFDAPPLCVLEAHTGESITIKFGTDKKWLPKMAAEDGQLILEFPKWYGAIAITGLALIFGMSVFKDALDVGLKMKENQKIDYEIQKLKQELGHDKDRELEIAKQINIFNIEIRKQNINTVQINGIDVYSK
jgi:hypothetical protein